MSENDEGYLWETPPELWRGVKSPTINWRGRVVSIFIAPKSGGEMVSVMQVSAYADRGLQGDRFFRDSWIALHRPDKAVSLIEEETLDSAAAELGVESLAQKSRRNIITRGVPLVALLDREFAVGGVRLRGMRLFEPCGHLVKLSGMPGIVRALEHRSGLKAAIVSDGLICAGDSIAIDNDSKLGAVA